MRALITAITAGLMVLLLTRVASAIVVYECGPGGPVVTNPADCHTLEGVTP